MKQLMGKNNETQTPAPAAEESTNYALSDALADAGEFFADMADRRAANAADAVEVFRMLAEVHAEEKRESISADALAKVIQAEAVSIREFRMTRGARPATAAEKKAAADGLSLASVKAYGSASALLAMRGVPVTEQTARLAYYAATGGLLKPLRKHLTEDSIPDGMSEPEKADAFAECYALALAEKHAEAEAKASKLASGEPESEPESGETAGEPETESTRPAEGEVLDALEQLAHLLPTLSAEGREVARGILSTAFSLLDAADLDALATASA